MDSPIRDVMQVSLDQLLAYQQSLQKESAGTPANQPGLVVDEASVIQKAGQLAMEILQTETPPNIAVDWNEMDTPENAYQAAKSILKYGV
jgi:hypothetical protein